MTIICADTTLYWRIRQFNVLLFAQHLFHTLLHNTLFCYVSWSLKRTQWRLLELYMYEKHVTIKRGAFFPGNKKLLALLLVCVCWVCVVKFPAFIMLFWWALTCFKPLVYSHWDKNVWGDVGVGLGVDVVGDDVGIQFLTREWEISGRLQWAFTPTPNPFRYHCPSSSPTLRCAPHHMKSAQ